MCSSGFSACPAGGAPCSAGAGSCPGWAVMIVLVSPVSLPAAATRRRSSPSRTAAAYAPACRSAPPRVPARRRPPAYHHRQKARCMRASGVVAGVATISQPANAAATTLMVQPTTIAGIASRPARRRSAVTQADEQQRGPNREHQESRIRIGPQRPAHGVTACERRPPALRGSPGAIASPGCRGRRRAR